MHHQAEQYKAASSQAGLLGLSCIRPPQCAPISREASQHKRNVGTAATVT